MTELPIRIDRGAIYPVSSARAVSKGLAVEYKLSAKGKWEAAVDHYFDDDGIFYDSAAELTSSKLLRGIKGIIFDFDGTLFDNALIPFYLILANPFEILRLRTERLVRKRFAGCDYVTPAAYYNAFFSVFGKACHRSPERIQNWYMKHFMPRMIRVLKKHYQLRPGVRELFRHYNAPNAMKIAVYSDYPMLKERLEALGFDSHPNIPLYGPESFGAQKPAVRPFLRIAEDLGVTPEEVLVIGDREETDGLGAFNAGMRFFCLETGRKKYFRLDPNRQRVEEQPHGPSLVMYAGAWDDLVELLIKKS